MVRPADDLDAVLAGGVGIVALFAPETLARFKPLWAAIDFIAKPLLLAFIIVLGWIVEPLLNFFNQIIYRYVVPFEKFHRLRNQKSHIFCLYV